MRKIDGFMDWLYMLIFYKRDLKRAHDGPQELPDGIAEHGDVFHSCRRCDAERVYNSMQWRKGIMCPHIQRKP